MRLRLFSVSCLVGLSLACAGCEQRDSGSEQSGTGSEQSDDAGFGQNDCEGSKQDESISQDFSQDLSKLEQQGWSFEGSPKAEIEQGKLCFSDESSASITFKCPQRPRYFAFTTFPGGSLRLTLGKPEAAIAIMDFAGDDIFGVDGSEEAQWDFEPSMKVELDIDWQSRKFQIRMNEGLWREVKFAKGAEDALSGLTLTRWATIPVRPIICVDDIIMNADAPPALAPCASLDQYTCYKAEHCEPVTVGRPGGTDWDGSECRDWGIFVGCAEAGRDCDRTVGRCFRDTEGKLGFSDWDSCVPEGWTPEQEDPRCAIPECEED